MVDDFSRLDEKARLQQDLSYLCKNYLGYKDWGYLHNDITSFLDKSRKRFKLVLVGRGHLKSSMITIGRSIQKVLKDYNTRILIANAIWDNARGFLNSISQFLGKGSKIEEVFGSFKTGTRGLGSWSKDALTIKQRTKPLPEATISTTGIERVQTSQHYDYIILDDVVVRENIGTREQREKVKNFFRDCLSLLEPTGEMVIIGTTWHEADLYNSIMKDEENNLKPNEMFDIFVRPACDSQFNNIVFPEKFTKEYLMNLKKQLGPYVFGSQYLLNPYPEEDMQFKKDWFQFYHTPPFEKMFISTVLDPSLGKETSDFMGITTTGVNASGSIYVLEARKFKCRVEQVPEECLKSMHSFRPDVFAVEEFAFQGVLKDSIRSAFKKANITAYIDELPKHTIFSKDDRIRSIIPYFSNGFIFMKKDQVDLVEQLIRYSPGRSHAEDDIIDSLAWQKMFWSRKPVNEERYNEQCKEGSLDWWLNKRRADRTKDIFEDMRYKGHGTEIVI